MKFEDDPLTVMNEVSLCNLFFVGVVYFFYCENTTQKCGIFFHIFEQHFVLIMIGFRLINNQSYSK